MTELDLLYPVDEADPSQFKLSLNVTPAVAFRRGHRCKSASYSHDRIDEKKVSSTNAGRHLEMDRVVIKSRQMPAESNAITNHRADKPSLAITV